ncbi:SIR2 family protein [Verrucomicrobiales bacterium]|nr:SIR2 family protein [Verrucomicrobiales bacterium]
MISGGKPNSVYTQIGMLLDELIADPNTKIPSPLLDLAAIDGFDVLITSGFDPFLSQALEQRRPGFDACRGGSGEFNPYRTSDIPSPLPSTFLYHILGSYNSHEFAVWEEDYIEYICGLLDSTIRDNHRNLFSILAERSLLLIGSPFTDWIVRFFLRAATGKRLSYRAQHTQDYLADTRDSLEKPMVFFFDKVVQSPRILSAQPASFTAKLLRHWNADMTRKTGGALLDSFPDEMEYGAIFVSYSSDDLDASLLLVDGIRRAGLPVWLDKKRLRVGCDWENNILRAVKSRTSLFIALISASTERDRTRFVHTERNWASERHIPGNVFYLPVIIDDIAHPTAEPEAFAACQHHKLPEGRITHEFARLLINYHSQWKEKGEIIDE